jgi:hypothetical protein
MAQDRSRLRSLIGLAAAAAAAVWAALGYSAAEDLRQRVQVQIKRRDEADKLRQEILRTRRAAPGRIAAGAAPATDHVRFLTETAQAAGITAAKLKGIIPAPPSPRDAMVEKGYSIELAQIDRKSLTQFLADVETLRPSLRTKELRLRRISPEGEIVAATAVIVYLEKKVEEKK